MQEHKIGAAAQDAVAGGDDLVEQRPVGAAVGGLYSVGYVHRLLL
jgi:hypothetical protein